MIKPLHAWGLAFLVVLAAGACRTTTPEIVVVTPDSAQLGGGHFYVDFVRDIQPLLESRCLTCHHEGSGVTGLSFQRLEEMIEVNAARRLVIPGEPERSALFLVTVLPGHYAEAMPADGHELNKGETWLIYQWILQGADWPEGVILQPPGSPELPPGEKHDRALLPPDIT